VAAARTAPARCRGLTVYVAVATIRLPLSRDEWWVDRANNLARWVGCSDELSDALFKRIYLITSSKTKRVRAFSPRNVSHAGYWGDLWTIELSYKKPRKRRFSGLFARPFCGLAF
jgi:hypothetical protein